MESVFRTGSLEQMVEEESNKDVSRRGFLGLLAGAGALVGLGSKAQAREWSHPLYEVLFNNANSQELKNAVSALNDKRYDVAGYILIPGYQPPRWYVNTVRPNRIKEYGGDNPTFWAALVLATEGIESSVTYDVMLKGNYNTKIPNNQNVFNFIKTLNPQKRKDLILLNKKEDEFLDKLKKSDLFKV